MKYAKIKTYHLNKQSGLEKCGDEEPYLTLGKLYPIDIWDGSAFEITDDTGAMAFCLVTGCAHLGNGDWEIIEVEDE